jgi:predicted nucleotidyltransferase
MGLCDVECQHGLSYLNSTGGRLLLSCAHLIEPTDESEETPDSPSDPIPAAHRRLILIFFAMAVLIVATVFVGFAHSYYLAGMFRAPRPSPIRAPARGLRPVVHACETCICFFCKIRHDDVTAELREPHAASLRIMPTGLDTITLAILHGSRAVHQANENSDWDVAVLGGHVLTAPERSHLRQTYATKFKVPEEKVDIADLRSDSPLLRYRVAMNGTLVEGTREAFRRFQIEAWKDYLNNGKMFELRSRFLKSALP